MAVLLLEQEDRLDREDSVKDYLPWFRPTYDGKEADILVLYICGRKKYAERKIQTIT